MANEGKDGCSVFEKFHPELSRRREGRGLKDRIVEHNKTEQQGIIVEKS